MLIKTISQPVATIIKNVPVVNLCCRKKLPAVPESLLKRRKAFATMKAMRIKKMLAEKKVRFCLFVC